MQDDTSQERLLRNYMKLCQYTYVAAVLVIMIFFLVFIDIFEILKKKT